MCSWIERLSEQGWFLVLNRLRPPDPYLCNMEIKAGEYNELNVLRQMDFGVYLDDGKEGILLPIPVECIVKIEQFFRISVSHCRNPEYKKLADLDNLLKFAYFGPFGREGVL